MPIWALWVAGRSVPTILSTRAITEDVEVTESVTYASMNSYGLEQISATIGIEDKAPVKRPYPTTRVSQHEVDNINKQFLTKLNDMVWLTRYSNLDSLPACFAAWQGDKSYENEKTLKNIKTTNLKHLTKITVGCSS